VHLGSGTVKIRQLLQTAGQAMCSA